MLSQNEISLMLACINYWTNSQVTVDYTRNDAGVVLLWVTNNYHEICFSDRGFTHFRRDFEWDLRQAIFKLISDWWLKLHSDECHGHLLITSLHRFRKLPEPMFTEEYVAIWHWVTAIEIWAPIPYMNFILGKGLSHTSQLIDSHYNNVIMSAMASQIISLMILYSTFYSDADQRKHQRSASLAFVRGIHRWPVYGPVTRKMFPFDDVIMINPWT